MMIIEIPGYRTLSLQYVVCDFNGTLAVDGRLIPGVRPLIIELGEKFEFHVLTADTFGSVEQALADTPCRPAVISGSNQAESKRAYVEKLGLARSVCIGNGRNDRLMLQDAGLGIGLVQAEGMAGELLAASDVVCPGIIDALRLLKEPKRLIATLRD